MTANEPPNPYTAPTAALSDATTATAEAPRAKTARPSRLLAAATSFFAYPLIGAGFLILGRRRHLVGWLAVGVVLLASMIIGARVPAPRLCLAAVVGAMLAVVAAAIHTAATKPATGFLGGRAWLVALAVVLGAKGGGLVVKYALVEAFQTPSGSMAPTVLAGDHIFVSKGRSGISRGDVIVFRYPLDPSTDYIKRVIAVGGDTVEVKAGVPSINGTPLAQTEVDGPCTYDDESGESARDCTLVRETNAGRTYTLMVMAGYHAQDFDKTLVPAGELFVIGDNRDNSMDSRKWGTLPLALVKGTATMTYWSMAPKGGGVRWSRVGHGIE